MARESWEDRVAAREVELTRLKQIVEPTTEKTGWQVMVGAFWNSPYLEKAMEYRRPYRESTKPKKHKKKNDNS